MSNQVTQMFTRYIKCYRGKTKFQFRNQMLLSDFKYKYDQKWEQNCALGALWGYQLYLSLKVKDVSFLKHFIA